MRHARHSLHSMRRGSLSPQAGISMVSILEKLGHEIDYPEELGCCGQPAFNAASKAPRSAMA